MRALLTPYWLAVSGLLALLAAVVFGNDLGVFNTDIKPEIYIAPQEMWGRYLSAWTASPYLGSPNFNVGLVPVIAVLALLRETGLSPEMTFKVFHLALWVVAAWGANRLLRSLVPSAGRWAGLAAGVVFLANPYTLTAGSTLAIALPLALLPWQLVCLVRALRAPRSWLWPAAFGLTFFAMSGMNVAIVPVFQLLAVIPVTWMVAREQGLRPSTAIRVVTRCAVAVIGVSLYWLVPAIAAMRTGSQIVQASESLVGIAKVSSFPEVLRGLGMWTLYGRSDEGPWLPEYAIYLTSGFVILVTLLWPVLALLSLRWTPPRMTRVVVGSIAVSAVVMVGIFPGSGLSPFAQVLEWVFTHVPAMAAFRTTNKVGALLTLAFALAIGYAAPRALAWMWRRDGLAPVAVSLVGILVGTWVFPALTGRLYTSELDIPDYWMQAADAVNAAPRDGRVLLLPGQTRSRYRWSEERPDDLPNSLFTQDAIIPETTPNTSPPGANFLSALDATFQSGHAPESMVSDMARYLGVNQVLVRHDVEWADEAGARPAVTSEVLAQDPGLFGKANFGRPGQNTLAPGRPVLGVETMLPPLQLYDVTDPKDTIRAESLTGQVVVSGDGWAVPAMSRAGLLEGSPLFRYAHTLSPEGLTRALGPRNRLVLTDTNRRREAITNRLTAGYGALLEPDEEAALMRTLGEDARDQTVLVRSGALVEASDEGGAFFNMPYGVAENAVDGDPDTSWLFGDFHRAPGTTLTITLPEPVRLDRFPIHQTPIGSVEIDTVSVTAGGESVTADFPEGQPATVDLGGVTARTITIEVLDLRGEGFNGVGIAEVGIPGADAIRTARMPLTFADLYSELGSEQRERFARTPLDVLFTRVRNADTTEDDTERALRRDFTLPDDRTFRATAHVRVTGDDDVVYDRIAGYGSEVVARSSVNFFDNPELRASMAADGDPDTAWVPGEGAEGAWWEVTGPERRIDEVVVTQRPHGGADADETLWAERVTIAVDGEDVTTATLEPGTTTIPLDGVRGSTVRMTIESVDGPAGGSPVGFTSIDAGAAMTTEGGSECLTVATIDGEPLRMRPTTERIAGENRPGTPWKACEQLSLVWGEHELRPVEDFQLDDLALRDVQGLQVREPDPAPVVTSEKGFGSDLEIEVGPAAGPYALIIGQGYDPRWEATVDGRSLGAPVQVDGYSVAWVIDEPGPHTIHVTYGPQRASDIALVVSAAALALSLAVVLLALWRTTVWAWATSGWVRSPWVRWRLAGLTRLATRVRVRMRSTAVRTPAEPRKRSAEWRVLTALDDHVPEAVPGWALETGLVVLAWFAVGWAGLVAALALVGVLRWRRVPARVVGAMGAALILLSGVVYIATLGEFRGEVSADAIRATLWPHRIAGAGLVIALVAGLMHAREKERPE